MIRERLLCSMVVIFAVALPAVLAADKIRPKPAQMPEDTLETVEELEEQDAAEEDEYEFEFEDIELLTGGVGTCDVFPAGGNGVIDIDDIICVLEEFILPGSCPHTLPAGVSAILCVLNAFITGKCPAGC